MKWAAFSFIDAGTLAVVDSAHAGQLVIVGSMAAQAVIGLYLFLIKTNSTDF